MSSGFVSGGTADAPVERDDAWLAAQREIEANIQKKAIEARRQDGKSLYETLEANKGILHLTASYQISNCSRADHVVVL